jgi:hypothetical protein
MLEVYRADAARYAVAPQHACGDRHVVQQRKT